MNISIPTLNKKRLAHLQALENKHVLKIVKKYIKLCRPSKTTVLTDSKSDISYIRNQAVKNREETPLRIKGHTVHFDGPSDQARDKKNTKVLLPKGESLSKFINTGDKKTCLDEIYSLLDGIMTGKEMFVLFYCLGPTNSVFSIPALQITDSSYVAHTENILYRQGYSEFMRLKGSDDFFYFIHSTGALENRVSKNIGKRRIYIDLAKNRVFSVNCQYGGNSLGLKKLALRLAIKKASERKWLCEHMFIMGVRPKWKKRVTYFTGAFPSGCGKTSTAMISGQTILGDDIAYLKPGKDGKVYAANVEQGMFGIIENVNPTDDPLIYQALTTEKELIFSNVLVANKTPYWLGMGKPLPKKGLNFSGKWKKGDRDKNGNKIPPAHKNARYTMRIEQLPNADPHIHDPCGVPISSIIYGGRDTDTTPCVVESFNWFHGVFMGASIESETTATTLGKTGVRKHNIMANMDFLVIPLGSYIASHLELGEKLKHPPTVFTTNYFLKHNGKFLNRKIDKKVWLMWMEGRVRSEYQVLTTPIGFIPIYEDLQKLFYEIFRKKYTRDGYKKQFAIRISKLLEKTRRIERIFRKEQNIPEIIFHQIDSQASRLKKARKKYRKNIVSPFEFKKHLY